MQSLLPILAALVSSQWALGNWWMQREKLPSPDYSSKRTKATERRPPDHRYANRSFRRPAQLPPYWGGDHDFFREVRWHIGDQYLTQALADPVYAAKLQNAVHTVIKEQALEHYREGRMGTSNRVSQSNAFARRLDQLMASP